MSSNSLYRAACCQPPLCRMQYPTSSPWPSFSLLHSVLVVFLLPSAAISGTGETINILQQSESSLHLLIRADTTALAIQKDAHGLAQISLDHFPNWGLPGSRALPSRTVLIGIPPHSSLRLNVLQARYLVKNLAARLATIPSDAPMTDLNDSQSRPPAARLSKSSDWNPAQVAELGESGFVRDQFVCGLTINPVQVDTSRHVLRIAYEIELMVSWNSPISTEPQSFLNKPLPAASISLAQSSVESPAVTRFYDGLVVNAQQAKTWRVKTGAGERGSGRVGERGRGKAGERESGRKGEGEFGIWDGQWQIRNQKSAIGNQKFALSPFAIGSEPAIKIKINEDGVYRLTGADLQMAGLPLNSIDPQNLELYNKGRAVPVFVAGARDGKLEANDYLEFYGEFNRGENTYLSPYSDTNVYWLVWNESPGLRFAEVDAGLYENNPDKLNRPGSYSAFVHTEQDWHFDRLLLITDELADHWFWKSMDANKQYDFTFTLDAPLAEGLAQILLSLHGSTHPPQFPNHHTICKLNGAVIADTLWSGQKPLLIGPKNVPAEILRAGENILRVELPGDSPAGEVDQQFFNWIEVTYKRPLQAINDYIEIHAETPGQLTEYQVEGFSSPEVGIIDSHGRRLVNYEATASGNGYRIGFQDQPPTANTRYFIYAGSAVNKPLSVQRDTPSTLRSPENSADYIMITHKNFRQAIQPLAELHRRRGLRVMVVDVEDVFDEFGDGFYTPVAIRLFLEYAYFNYQPPSPAYVLLAGDGHYGFDKKVVKSWGKESFIPTYMRYTISWGVTSSDNYFATVSGDDYFPDLFVGRLPVNSAAETDAIVQKIVAYEEQPLYEPWRRRVALSVGNGSFFEQQARDLENRYVPPAFDIPKLFTNPRSKYFGSTEELVDIFNNGTAIINFIGHGGGAVFFDSELFLLEDIVLLQNARRLPVVLSWSCFIGYFDNPFTPSLGEELVRLPQKGVIAHFGSAGRAWLYGDYFFNLALFESLFTRNRRVIGQFTTEAKILLLSRYGGYRDMVDNYALLGDPALEIGFPEHAISLQVDNPSFAVGDSLVVRGTIPDKRDATVELAVYGPVDSLLATQQVPASLGNLAARLPLPAIGKDSWNGMVKAYFWNSSTDGSGAATFSVNAPLYTEVRTEPEQPLARDSTFIFATVQSGVVPAAIDSVVCEWSGDRQNWQRLQTSLLHDGHVRTLTPIVSFSDITIFYRFRASYREPADGAVKSVESPVYSYRVRHRADLEVRPESIVVSGAAQVQLQIRVRNRGGIAANDVEVIVYDGVAGSPESSVIFSGQIPAITADSSTNLLIDWPGQPAGSREITVSVDPENVINEQYEYNNIASRHLSLVTVSQGSGGWLAGSDTYFAAQFAADLLSRNAEVQINRGLFTGAQRDQLNAVGLQPVPIADSSFSFYTLTMSDSSALGGGNFEVRIHYASSDEARSAAIYFAKNQSDTWHMLPGQIDTLANYISTTQAYALGHYAIIANNDNDPPRITVKVHGQNFSPGDYLSSQPEFSIVVEDAAGIDFARHPLQVELDGELVDSQKLVLSRALDTPTLGFAAFSPELAPSSHTINIRATDNRGNVGESQIAFVVVGDFTLQSIANHPNPFATETIIAYTLPAEASEVSIKIYTVSGRMIRSFTYYNEVGYVEHVWDGRDASGDEVANGVYYLRFVATRGEQRLERIEKMARLR